MTTTEKEGRIHIRANQHFKQRMKLAAELSSNESRKVTVSDLIREAVDEKLMRLSKKHPQLATP